MRKTPYLQILGAILVIWDKVLSPLLGTLGNVDEVCSFTRLSPERCGANSMIQAVFAGSWTEPVLTLAGIALILYGERKRTSVLIKDSVRDASGKGIASLATELKSRQSRLEDRMADVLISIENMQKDIIQRMGEINNNLYNQVTGEIESAKAHLEHVNTSLDGMLAPFDWKWQELDTRYRELEKSFQVHGSMREMDRNGTIQNESIFDARIKQVEEAYMQVLQRLSLIEAHQHR